MNHVAFIHLLAAILVIAAAEPLIRRRVKPNHWYGVRIPAAFASEAAWYDINAYGGRVLRLWGCAMGGMAVVGLLLPREAWPLYVWGALGVILGGLLMAIITILRYARRLNR